MTELPPVPSDPAALKAWIASLSTDDLAELTELVAGGAFTSGLGSPWRGAPRNREIELPPPPEQPSVLTLTIELRGSKPRIWRRLALAGDLTLDEVHTLFQAAMGWTDSHLHRFQPGTGKGYDQPYFVTRFDEEEGDEGTREDGIRLDQVLLTPGDRLTYLYDFGDGWEHRVTLESLAPLTSHGGEPVCLAGARACPPEDIGGLHGHDQVARWLRAGAPAARVPEPFADAQAAFDWLPVGYHPDAFDAAEATAAMRVWARGEHMPWHGVPEPLADALQGLQADGWEQASTWLTELGPRPPVALDGDDVQRAARPWLAVLDAVGAGTTLTAAGYLPPAVVEDIAQAAGVTDWWIGEANREDHTWPVATLRQNAQDVGLLRKAKGTLAPTARARAVAGQPLELVATVLERLPLGTGLEAESGWFLLLGLAAGEPHSSLDEKVALLLAGRGWRAHGTAEVTASAARRAHQRTLEVLESMAGGGWTADRTLVTRLARACLFGVTDTR